MSIIRVPSCKKELYKEAKSIQRELIKDGYNKPLFEIMTDLMKDEQPRRKRKAPPGWSI